MTLAVSREHSSFNPDYALGIVTRVEKPQRNEKLERFCAEGILVNMLRSKIVKRALQHGFSGRSRWLLHNLGSMSLMVIGTAGLWYVFCLARMNW
jgi:hypothetical protein